jgi:uncharacterized membrane protein
VRNMCQYRQKPPARGSSIHVKECLLFFANITFDLSCSVIIGAVLIFLTVLWSILFYSVTSVPYGGDISGHISLFLQGKNIYKSCPIMKAQNHGHL